MLPLEINVVSSLAELEFWEILEPLSLDEVSDVFLSLLAELIYLSKSSTLFCGVSLVVLNVSTFAFPLLSLLKLDNDSVSDSTSRMKVSFKSLFNKNSIFFDFNSVSYNCL